MRFSVSDSTSPSASDGNSASEAETAAGARAVRVSVREAAILQDLPAEHPWQGSQTAIYRQVGNAFPVGVAYAVLAQLLLQHEETGVAPVSSTVERDVSILLP